MKKPEKKFVLPIAIMLIGAAWTLNVIKAIPGVDWLWILLLAGIGLIALTQVKNHRSKLISGGFFLTAAAGEAFRQAGRLPPEWEIPLLIIVVGLLMLLAQLLPAPESGDASKSKQP